MGDLMISLNEGENIVLVYPDSLTPSYTKAYITGCIINNNKQNTINTYEIKQKHLNNIINKGSVLENHVIVVKINKVYIKECIVRYYYEDVNFEILDQHTKDMITRLCQLLVNTRRAGTYNLNDENTVISPDIKLPDNTEDEILSVIPNSIKASSDNNLVALIKYAKQFPDLFEELLEKY